MIALITPTGARAAQFALCRRWMMRQNYKGKVLWIIVDDARPRTTDIVASDFRKTWLIHKVYPKPLWHPGMNTQGRNIFAGLDALRKNYNLKDIEAAFIIEDDDYYKPIYLSRMMQEFDGFNLLGETNTIYYNVISRRYIVNMNTAHASLFQTAFKPAVLQYVINAHREKFIDVRLWKSIPNRKLFHAGSLSVGIKGMPGRRGIGAGHNPMMAMRQDINLNWLKRHIGTDIQYYAPFYKTVKIVRPDLMKRKSYD